MAQSMQLSDLRQRFYDRFDEGSSQYIDQAQANRLINEAGRHLHNWIVSESEDYIVRIYPIQVNVNQQDYPLPSDFFKDLKVWGVYTQTSGNIPYYWPLMKLMKNEFRGGPATVFRYPFYGPFGYLILGQFLRITPIPVYNNFNLEMWYAPHYAELINDSDVVDVSVAPGWDEFIVNQAVIGAKLKEEADVADLVARNREIKDMIQQQVINRDLGMPSRLTEFSGNMGIDNVLFPGGGFV
jgi:hypothetical protein